MKTVTVTCACGAHFQREVKRGRPQIWCPTCTVMPFTERNKVVAVAVVADEAESGERIKNENDLLDSFRVDIEAAMVLINLDHKVRFAAHVASGLAPWEAGEKASHETFIATTTLYATYRPNKKPIGGAALDDRFDVV